MKTTLPKRFLTLRDKDRDGGSHRRSKSSEPGKSRASAADTFMNMFRDGASKQQSAKAKEEVEKEAAKIDELTKWAEDEGLTGVTREQVRLVLASLYAAGDVAKARELLRFQRDALDGVIHPYNPDTHMLGAENRGAVTCYLDSLLFAMFAKMEPFECMLLRRDYPDDSHRNLAVLLRLWVSLLRSGKLIRTDMTEAIQNALADCGWSDARLLEQQDTSEAFAFITETLQLPLLTLQVDLFHQGKGDADDHKVVFERLLNLAVPADPEGKGLKLEDCLEEYFNTRVDVLRDKLDDKKSVDQRIEEGVDESLTESPTVISPKPNPLGSSNTIRVVTDHDEEDEEGLDALENLPPMQRRWTNVDSPASSSSTPTQERPETRPSTRVKRSTSLIQRLVVDADGKPIDPDTPTLLQKVRRQGSTVVKAVTIPAWQFFKLIPWHSAAKEEPLNDTDVAKQLNNRPVVGICLKRYMMTESGQPQRQNTFIDIPDSLRLPHFMMVNDTKVEEANGLNAEYKLVLQSVVCHRGESLHSGHYVSFSRVAPKLLTDNRRHEADPPPDYEDAQWVMFDDLAEQRVKYVDDIKQSLREEMPYLLFYQIVPMVDYACTSDGGTVVNGATGTDVKPPSYNDSTVNITATTTDSSYSPTNTNPDSDRPQISRETSGYFDGTTFVTTAAHSSTGPSIRFSSELERPLRLSLDYQHQSAAGPGGDRDPGHLNTSSSRRSSVFFSDSAAIAATHSHQQSHSPAVTPNEELTGGRLSRAAARFTKSKDKEKEKDKDKEREKEKEKDTKERSSRPASQTGEGRMSLTMSRLGGLMRTSKEPLREVVSAGAMETHRDPYEGELATSQHLDHHMLNGMGEGHVTRKDNKDKTREKDKAKHGHHHLHHAHRSMTNGGEPERECVVM